MKILLFSILLLFFFSTGYVLAQTDIAEHKSCRYCNMDRQRYSHSRMFIRYSDGSAVAVCSLHCAAVDLARNTDNAPLSIEVADYISTRLIRAETAFWVIGGNRQGVMTSKAKWAFEKKADAEAFIRECGGRPASYEEAIREAYVDIYKDSRMIRGKRMMHRMQSGCCADR